MALTIGEADAVLVLLRVLSGKGRWADIDPTAPVSEHIADKIEYLRDRAAKVLQVGGPSIITDDEVMEFLAEWRDEGEYEPGRPIVDVETNGRV